MLNDNSIAYICHLADDFFVIGKKTLHKPGTTASRMDITIINVKTKEKIIKIDTEDPTHNDWVTYVRKSHENLTTYSDHPYIRDKVIDTGSIYKGYLFQWNTYLIFVGLDGKLNIKRYV